MTDGPEPLLPLPGEPPTLDDQISAVEREIAFRGRVYPRQVAAHRMQQKTADREIETMRAVHATLLMLRARS